MGVDQTSLDRIRNATFPTNRRGYDKHEVEKFLGRLADWLETGAGDETRSDTVKRELEKVGERTGAILAQAEESAQQIRAEAEEEARGTVNAANLQATEARGEADQYASETRASAERQAREQIESAQAQARRLLEEAEQRREDTEALIVDLLRRREDAMADTEELSRKLTDAVAQHRSEAFRPPEPLETAVEEEVRVQAEQEDFEPPVEDEELEPPVETEIEPDETEIPGASLDTEEHTVIVDPEETVEREAETEMPPERQADLRHLR